MAWCRGSAIRKTVSMSGLRRWFIAVIWNSYSKSATARRPRTMMPASSSSAKCINRVENGRTSTFEPSWATSARTISTLWSVVNIGPFSSLRATPMISRSTSFTARPMMSICPLVTGSKVPGYRPIRIAFLPVAPVV